MGDNLLIRVKSLEAILRHHRATPSCSPTIHEYPFLDVLTGEDKIQAEAVICENSQLKAEVVELRYQISQLEQDINHLNEAIDEKMND